MGEKLLEIRELMDEIKALPMLKKVGAVERLAEMQFDLMELLVMGVENAESK